MRREYSRSAGMSLLIAAIFCTLILPASAAPQAVSSTDLIEHARQFDGQEVSFSGETIGDLMIRGDHAWINASDGANAIGLWLPVDQARQVKTFGSYRYRGDKIVVVGVFHRACPEHGGDMDIHVNELTVTAPGEPLTHPLQPFRLVLAALLTALASALYVADRRRGRRAESRKPA